MNSSQPVPGNDNIPFRPGTKAVIDTCILFDRFSRTIILYLVALGYLLPVISKIILRELVRSLTAKVKGMPKKRAKAIARNIERRFSLCGKTHRFSCVDRWRIWKLSRRLRDPGDAHVLYLSGDKARAPIISDNVDDLRGYKNVSATAMDHLIMRMLDSTRTAQVSATPLSSEKVEIAVSELAQDALAYAAMRMRPGARDFLSAVVKMNEQGLFLELKERISPGDSGELTELGRNIQRKMDRFEQGKDKSIQQIG